MSDTKEITWPETIAYKITNALRFSGIIDEDNYRVEQKARNEITPIIRRWCIPIERIEDWQARAEAAEKRVAELEAQLAAQAWRPMDGEDYPRDPNQKIQMIVNGYCGEREEWQTDIGQEIRAPYRCIRGWRPIDPPALA